MIIEIICRPSIAANILKAALRTIIKIVDLGVSMPDELLVLLTKC